MFVCAERLWSALRPTLERLLAAQGTDAPPLKLSFIGHSMGGLILRQVAFLISEDATFASNLEFDTIAFIASPFLGCRRLGSGGAGGVAPLMSAFGPSLMRAGLRFVKGETGPQLLLDNDALERLTDEAHCAVLRRFGRRLLYVNGTGDWLVNFESCSLLAAEEIELVLPPSAAACAARGGPVLWTPTDAELPASVMPPSLALDVGRWANRCERRWTRAARAPSNRSGHRGIPSRPSASMQHGTTGRAARAAGGRDAALAARRWLVRALGVPLFQALLVRGHGLLRRTSTSSSTQSAASATVGSRRHLADNVLSSAAAGVARP